MNEFISIQIYIISDPHMYFRTMCTERYLKSYKKPAEKAGMSLHWPFSLEEDPWDALLSATLTERADAVKVLVPPPVKFTANRKTMRDMNACELMGHLTVNNGFRRIISEVENSTIDDNSTTDESRFAEVNTELILPEPYEAFSCSDDFKTILYQNETVLSGKSSVSK
jgi:hypothetical protein